jgi:hypothetical protein
MAMVDTEQKAKRARLQDNGITVCNLFAGHCFGVRVRC